MSRRSAERWLIPSATRTRIRPFPPDNNIGNGVAIAVDTTAPIATIGNRPADPTNINTGSFSFSANESGSVFECKLDAGSYAACTSPFGYQSLSDGSHSSVCMHGIQPATPEPQLVTPGLLIPWQPWHHKRHAGKPYEHHRRNIDGRWQ